jgi:uncharacterized protein (TIGR03083 family)
MTATTTPVPAAAMQQSSPERGAEVLLDQVSAYVAELRELSADEWAKATDCPEWDVRKIAAHVAGALDGGAHMRVFLRHAVTAKRRGLPMVDGINACQVADRTARSGPEIADEIERLAPKAARKRRTTPGLMRRRPVSDGGLRPGSTLGYLFDVIYQRDIWMHRVDTARATGRALRPTAGDAEMVGQVIRDLALDWTGPTAVLELTGPGAGRWLLGSGEPAGTARTESVEYLRLLADRPADPTITVDGDPAVGEALRRARVAF